MYTWERPIVLVIIQISVISMCNKHLYFLVTKHINTLAYYYAKRYAAVNSCFVWPHHLLQNA